MLLAAIAAVLFETLPILRGGVGNVIYFFVWTAASLSAPQVFDDPTGLQLLYRSFAATLQEIDPTGNDNFHFSLHHWRRSCGPHAFCGTELTGRPTFSDRAGLDRRAVAHCVCRVMFFHRFDPARCWFKRRSAASTRRRRQPRRRIRVVPACRAAARLISRCRRRSSGDSLLPHRCCGTSAHAEGKALVVVRRGRWVVDCVGFAPSSRSRRRAVGGVDLADLRVVVDGIAGSRHETESLIFSSARALPRQLPAVWMAGVLLAVLTGGGVGTRLLLAGDHRGFAAWLAGAFFIPSLALALGVWSGNSKAFEALYTVWWYIGPAHHTPGLDFIGTTSSSSQRRWYTCSHRVLLGVSYWGRRIRMAICLSSRLAVVCLRGDDSFALY